MRTILVGLAIVTAMGGTAVAGPPPVDDDSIAIALVVNSNEMMMGNTSIEPADSAARMPGMLPDLADGLAHLDLPKLLPPGSEALVITYEVTPQIRMALGPIHRLDGVFGSQHDYYNRLGIEMVPAVELAMTELARAPSPHKLLFVISDGNTTNNETAKAILPALRTQMLRQGIVPCAIIYKSGISEPGNVVSLLDPNVRTAPTAQAIAPAVAIRIAQELAVVSRQQIAALPIASSCSFWKQLLLGCAGVMLLALGVWGWRTKRR